MKLQTREDPCFVLLQLLAYSTPPHQLIAVASIPCRAMENREATVDQSVVECDGGDSRSVIQETTFPPTSMDCTGDQRDKQEKQQVCVTMSEGTWPDVGARAGLSPDDFDVIIAKVPRASALEAMERVIRNNLLKFPLLDSEYPDGVGCIRFLDVWQQPQSNSWSGTVWLAAGDRILQVNGHKIAKTSSSTGTGEHEDRDAVDLRSATGLALFLRRSQGPVSFLIARSKSPSHSIAG